MPVPKKPNRRKKKKTKHILSREELERKAIEYKYRRMEQAMTVKNRITESAGDILKEVPTFVKDLDNWITLGKSVHGKGRIESANRDIEWQLHEDISNPPEVWIRAPKLD